MAEVGPAREATTAPAQTQDSPETNQVSTVITESQKSGDPPRETLTKIARMKQMGSIAVTGLMVVASLSQIAGQLLQEDERR